MSLKKLILALTGFGLVIIAFTSIDFYIEQQKHNHPISQIPAQRANEQKIVFNANQEQKQAPKLSTNTNIPKDIPPAMLEAMKKQGISVEDLQGGTGNANGMNGTFPEEMMKALNEQKQQPQQDAESGVVMKALQHIISHDNKEEIARIQDGIKLANSNPENVQNIIDVVNLFIKHGEVKAGEIYIQKGIVANPTNAELYTLYGLILSKDFRFEKAKEQWVRSNKLQETAEVNYYLGMLHRYKLIDENKAKEYFAKAKSLPTDNKELKKNIEREAGK